MEDYEREIERTLEERDRSIACRHRQYVPIAGFAIGALARLVIGKTAYSVTWGSIITCNSRYNIFKR